MTTREPKIPGPDHPITIEKTGQRVVARVGEHVVADTTRALTLREANYPPVHYIPLADVDQALLANSSTQTYQPSGADRDSEHQIRNNPAVRVRALRHAQSQDLGVLSGEHARSVVEETSGSVKLLPRC